MEFEQLEVVWVEIKRTKSKSLLVGAVYRPPNADVSFFEYFTSMIEKAISSDNEVFILGDFNCDLLSNTPCVNMRKLTEIANLLQISQLVKKPTRITDSTSTLIDHIYTSNVDIHCKTGVVATSVSDHMLIIISNSAKKSTQ